MSIKVAVRVRPFNQREKNLNSKLCVDMVGNTTVLKSDGRDDYHKERNFIYDYSFWSHDGYTETSQGLLIPKSARYVDQKKVFSLLGEGLLENAWQGYHCTLFAYGQTGSGKSYSVMGYKPNIGIVPMACERIFEKIDEENNKNLDDESGNQKYVTYQVTIGMIEIYNEKVQDLLQPVSAREPQGLKIRESQTLGFYAEGQKKMPVRNFKEIEQRIEQGSKNRSIGATLMNSHSSRAHTIISIELKQIITQGKGKKVKYSVINLVDLAGSEKVAKTGSTGERLVEATNINKSLSTLGKVISTLADKSTGQNKNRQVPYRDSTLTKILKNALGGNSKTIMICAISPAIDNYDETLSTLRYADQAKRIQNKATINEETSDILAKQLQQENLKLREKILMLEEQMKNGTLNINQPENKVDNSILQQLKELQEQLEANRLLQDDQKKSYEEKIKELEKERFEQNKKDSYNVDQNKPHISNLNEDPQLNNQVLFSIDQDVVKIGRKKDPKLEIDIAINGLGIKPYHCNVYKRDGKFYLGPNPNDPSTGEHLYLNGQKVFDEKEIMHNDRLILGQNATFLIKLPGQEQRGDPPLKENQLTWEFAHDEYLEQFKMFQEEIQKNLQEKIQNDLDQNNKLEYEVKVLEMQVQYEDKITKMKRKYERRIEKVKQRCLKWKTDGSEDEDNTSDEDSDFFEDEEVIDVMDPDYEIKRIEQQERIKQRKADRAERRKKRQQQRKIRGLGAAQIDEEILSKKNGVLLKKDENGIITDQKGNQVETNIYGDIIDKQGNEYVIDQAGNIIDKDGNVIGRLIDQNGNIIDKDGNITGQIIDISGNIIDKDGNVIGQMIDFNGNIINKDGNIIDQNGHIMDKDGNILDKNGKKTGQKVDQYGNILDEAGNIVGQMRFRSGNRIDKSGNILDKYGNKIDINGNIIGECGKLMDKNGNIVDKDGNLTGEKVDMKGNILDKDGNIIGQMRDQKGLLINKLGQTIDKNGNPIDKNGNELDKNGNIICQNGILIDQNGNILDKNGKITGQTVDLKGNIIDKDGNIIGQIKDKNGYIINKFGEILNDDGNRIDINGNILDQNGNIIGIDEKFKQLKKNQNQVEQQKDEGKDKDKKQKKKKKGKADSEDDDSDDEKGGKKKKNKKKKKNMQDNKDTGAYSSDEEPLDPEDPQYLKKKKIRDLNRLKKLLTNKNITDILKGDKQLQKILEEEGFIVGGKKEKKKKIKKGLTEQELRERWINRLLLQLYPRVETLNLIAEEMQRDIKFMVIQDQKDDFCVRVQNMENKSFYHWHLGTILNQTNIISDLFEEYQATEELPVYEDRENDDPFWFLEENDYEPERFRIEDYLDELRDKEEIDSQDQENTNLIDKKKKIKYIPSNNYNNNVNNYNQDSSKYSGSNIDLTGRDFIGGVLYTIIEILYDDVSSSKYTVLKVFTLLVFLCNFIGEIILIFLSFSISNKSGKIGDESNSHQSMELLKNNYKETLLTQQMNYQNQQILKNEQQNQQQVQIQVNQQPKRNDNNNNEYKYVNQVQRQKKQISDKSYNNHNSQNLDSQMNKPPHRKQSNLSQLSNGQRPLSKGLQNINKQSTDFSQNRDNISLKTQIKKNSSGSSQNQKFSTQSNFRPSQIQYNNSNMLKSQIDDDEKLAKQLQSEYDGQLKANRQGNLQQRNYEGLGYNLQQFDFRDHENDDNNFLQPMSQQKHQRNGTNTNKLNIIKLDQNKSNNYQKRQKSSQKQLKQSHQNYNQPLDKSNYNQQNSTVNLIQQQQKDLNEISINSQMNDNNNYENKSNIGLNRYQNVDERYKAQDQI
ncbi:SMAD/FHA domain [Pseudocohnilembus persalinus]|uniref:SMAD/FHA domain n=1 Tax=Pseudocohnilembus persalinus TaxID=266149 RepID=A0A0V0QMC7_PSEPJ|nr:SMAD/FHA domain [Pseudocohnilembus persalinus]|eukprot:KRX03487.1 SMAD/FHA domain [Pseudocohnilembus persalinus]